MVNLSSIENISKRNVENGIVLFRTFVAESFNCLKVALLSRKNYLNSKYHLLFVESYENL